MDSEADGCGDRFTGEDCDFGIVMQGATRILVFKEHELGISIQPIWEVVLVDQSKVNTD